MLMERPGADNSVMLRSLAAGLSDRNITVLHQNLDMVYDLVENLPDYWPSQDLIGNDDSELVADWAAAWISAKRAVVKSGHPQILQLDLKGAGAPRILEAHVLADRDAEGHRCGLITVLTDVTDLRERESAVVSLMREVSHRSRNMLAIVQSIAAQTALHSDGVAGFLQKFRGRIQALSGIQDLVTEADWRGIPFRSLLHSQIKGSGHIDTKALLVDGENPTLGPNAALHIGLALHELATNAERYGALSRQENGRICVSATLVRKDDTHDDLLIEWLESGAAPPPGPPEPRFGSLVLERIVPLSMGGSAEHRIGRDGVSYRLHVPAGHFET